MAPFFREGWRGVVVASKTMNRDTHSFFHIMDVAGANLE